MKPARLLLLVSVLSALPLAAETQRYLVVPSSKAAALRLQIANDPASIAQRRVRTLRNIGVFALDLTPAEAVALRRSRDVAVVEPVVPRFAFGAPGRVLADASRYAQQIMPWGVEALRAPRVWSATRGEAINVAVADTGIDPNHPDLAGAYMGGHNTFNRLLPPFDDNTHGTHVAGTIAAADNAFGVVGVAPGVRLWSVKVLDSMGSGSSETVSEGIDWVVGAARDLGGRWVINLSLGSSDHSVIEERAVKGALEAGVIVVAATGNNGEATVAYPARYPGVIAVGAVNEQSLRASFSSYGPEQSIVAPGVRVASTLIDGVHRVAQLEVPLGTFDGWPVGGSLMATVSGDIVDCGLGFPEHIPPSVAGRIALIQRGEITFREKARAAKEAGALAVIIWNNEVEETTAPNWVMLNGGDDPYWKDYAFPLTIGVTRLIGERLRSSRPEAEVSLRFEHYAAMSGTSMAAPHVTGVVALLLALDPLLTAAQVKDVLERTARDTHTPGYDQETSWGVVDALAAAQKVAPDRVSTPPAPGKRRRAVN